jgi:hypothetical protein
MERDAELLCAMDMGKTRGVGDDAIGNKVFCSRPRARTASQGLGKVIIGSIIGSVTGPPAALNVFGNMFSLLADISAHYATKARPQAGILDHEGHQLGGIAANAEEFQAMLLNKVLEGGMSR